MVLNYIWIAFFLIAFVVAIIRTLGWILQQNLDISFLSHFTIADRDVFSRMAESTFSMAETSVTLAIALIGVMSLWLGLMKIGEKGGAINILARIVSPFFSRIFPGVPARHPAMGAMMMNFSANMLGLDNSATPLGLKAMDELQKLNPKKDTASNAQIMFLVLNTSGLTIIPISILTYRLSEGSANPAEVFLPLLLTTFCSTMVGLLAVALIQRINLFNKVVIAYLLGLGVLIGGMFTWLTSLPEDAMKTITPLLGNFILFSFIIFFLVSGIRKRIRLYEAFIEGAKEGFNIAIKIIPYLVAMLVAVGVFRASGTLDFIVDGLASFFGWMGFDTRFVEGLPTAFMKPLSGTGSRGMMLEVFQNDSFGPDSFAGRLVSVLQGSTETTFYTLVVYYGAVNITKTRYTLTCGLIADLTAIIAAILFTYFFFG